MTTNTMTFFTVTKVIHTPMLCLSRRLLKNLLRYRLHPAPTLRPRDPCAIRTPLRAWLVLVTSSQCLAVHSAGSLPQIQVFTEVRNAANIAEDQQGVPYADSPALENNRH
ncbi:MAG: hypothetical protein ACE37N_09490 [Pseudohongiellaceae bacterium]